MPNISDEIYFGEYPLGIPKKYRDIRKITDDSQLIEALKCRLETFLINQTHPLREGNYSAFPLAVMTCVGIQTLGEIFLGESKIDEFVEISKKIDQKFSQKPNKKFIKNFPDLDKKDKDVTASYGSIVYTFFRNAIMHGYRGKGVFLSYDIENAIIINEESFCICLNPNLLWDGFKKCFFEKFNEAKEAQQNNTEKQNCLKYIKKLLA